MLNDLRFAVRGLVKRPGFTAAAVLTLGVGIGATTAMFSVVRGVLLAPFPYERPDELVSLWTRYLPSSGQDIPKFPLSPPEMIDYREGNRSMQDVVPYGTRYRTLGGDGAAPQRVRVGFLGAGMFDLLGVRATVGRTFAPEEELPDAAPVLVLSHRLWVDRFGGDSAVVGRTVPLNGQAARVIGVMPAGFVFPDASVELWAPFGLDEAKATNRFAHYLLALGRLKPGVTLEEAKRDLARITDTWMSEHEHHAAGHFIYLRGFRDDLVGDRGKALWLLMAAVGLVLVIATVNVANLLLARTESRHTEIAIRSALGAGRVRLARHFLVESLVLAGTGAAVGIVLAAWATPALLAVYPQAIPRAEAVRIDGIVLAFAVATGFVAAVLFGLVPAIRRRSPAAALASARATGGGRAPVRLRGALVGVEAAVGVLVILAAGLVTRSFAELARVDPGVRSEGVLLFDLQLPSADYPPEAVPDAYASLLDRLRSLPGVQRVGATSSVPVADDPTRQDIGIEGRPQAPPGVPRANADIVAVQPGYFGALGIPLLAGRLLDATDREGALLVAVVNEEAERRYWPEGAVGHRFRYSSGQPWITIVGVVGDTKVEGLIDAYRAQVFLPHDQLAAAQGSTGRSLTITVRTAGDPLSVAAPARAVVRQFDSRLPVANLRTMDHVLATAVAPQRFSANLLGGFAAIALLLAAVGVYGVTSYTVSRRTREIGVRMALGARTVDVLAKVIRESVRPVVVGALLGLAVGLAGAGVFSRFVFGVGVRDPLTFGVAPVVLLLVAIAATWLPARRASRIDPMEALRYE